MRDGIAAGVAPRYHAVQTWPVAWIKGNPPLSTLFGIDASQSDIFRIAAWRCISCGLIEFYVLTRTGVRHVKWYYERSGLPLMDGSQ